MRFAFSFFTKPSQSPVLGWDGLWYICDLVLDLAVPVRYVDLILLHFASAEALKAGEVPDTTHESVTPVTAMAPHGPLPGTWPGAFFASL